MVTPDAARFALVAEGASDAELELLPELMNRAGLGTATLSAWSESTTRGSLDLRVRTLARAVDALTAGGRRVQVSLSPLPDELAEENARGGHRRSVGVGAAAGAVDGVPAPVHGAVEPAGGGLAAGVARRCRTRQGGVTCRG